MTVDLQARVFEQIKALSNETRFELVRLLAAGERCVCDLEARLELPQSKVSYHLGILKDAGLLSSESRGKNTYYSLVLPAFFQLGGQLLEELFEASPALTHQNNSIC